MKKIYLIFILLLLIPVVYSLSDHVVYEGNKSVTFVQVPTIDGLYRFDAWRINTNYILNEGYTSRYIFSNFLDNDMNYNFSIANVSNAQLPQNWTNVSAGNTLFTYDGDTFKMNCTATCTSMMQSDYFTVEKNVTYLIGASIRGSGIYRLHVYDEGMPGYLLGESDVSVSSGMNWTSKINSFATTDKTTQIKIMFRKINAPASWLEIDDVFLVKVGNRTLEDPSTANQEFKTGSERLFTANLGGEGYIGGGHGGDYNISLTFTESNNTLIIKRYGNNSWYNNSMYYIYDFTNYNIYESYKIKFNKAGSTGTAAYYGMQPLLAIKTNYSEYVYGAPVFNKEGFVRDDSTYGNSINNNQAVINDEGNYSLANFSYFYMFDDYNNNTQAWDRSTYNKIYHFFKTETLAVGDERFGYTWWTHRQGKNYFQDLIPNYFVPEFLVYEGAQTITITLNNTKNISATIDSNIIEFNLSQESNVKFENFANSILLDNSPTIIMDQTLSAGTHNITNDTIPPLTTIISPTASNYNTGSRINFNITTDENATCLFNLNNGINYTMTTITTLNHYYSNSTLTANTYTMYIYCNDSANNLNNTENITFTLTTPTTTTSTATTSSSSAGYWKSIEQISEQELEQGSTIELGRRDKVEFTIANKPHQLGLIELTESSATFEIESTSNEFTLNIGEFKKIEMTNDEFYDFYIEVKSINDNKAEISIQEIHKSIHPQTNIEISEEVDEQVQEEIIQNKSSKWWLWLILGSTLLSGVALTIYYLESYKPNKSNKLHKK